MINPEDKYFVVTYANGLYIRSSGEKGNNSLGEDFDLDEGDVIHAVGVEVTKGITFHKFDRIYRDGTRYNHPFDGFPLYQASPTSEYWSAEKDSMNMWMKETNNPELSTPNPVQPTPTKKYVGWRVLHRAEGGYDATAHQKKFPPDMPAVVPPADIKKQAIDMTKDIQNMSFALMQNKNPNITKQLWTKVHDGDRAFTNGEGFNQKNDPRRNYVMGENLSSKNLPKYDKAGRLCAGAFVRGEVRGDKLVCIAGVHGIDANKPMPSLQTILDNNWYLYAITLYGSGTKKEHVGHFPQGGGGPVVIPFIFEGEIVFDLSWFEKWESDELPDPLRMYKLE